MRIGVYPGTFDPITKGHFDIIIRSLNIVDKLIIAVAQDTSKDTLFSLKERVSMIDAEIKEHSDSANPNQFLVKGFQGLLVNFVHMNNASLIIRGLRAISDFEYEFQMANANYKIAENIETILLPAAETTHFISSSIVKEIAKLKGNVSSFVSSNVKKALWDKYHA